MADYAASMTGEGYLYCTSVPAYAVGTGDFSFAAWVQTTSEGVIASLIGDGENSQSAGWIVYVGSDQTLGFFTGAWVGSDESVCEVTTVGTPLADGCWHHVAAVRSGSTLLLYVDAQPQEVTATSQGGSSPPFDFDANVFQIGSCEGSYQPCGGNLVGSIEEVTLWSAALTQQQVVQLLTCSVDRATPSLIGYWPLDNDLTDRSATRNHAHTHGPVPFVQTFDADVCYGESQYCYASFASGGGGTPDTVTRSQLFSVQAGTPALIVALTTSREDLAAPAGVALSVVDPDGNRYDTAQNTRSLFVQLTAGVPTLITAIQPPPGMWTVTTSAPGTTEFVLAFQTVPASDTAATIQATLQPVYGDAPSRIGPVLRGSADDALFRGLSLPTWVVVGAAVVGAAVAAAAVVVGAAAVAPVAIVMAVGILTAEAVATVVQLAKDLSSNSRSDKFVMVAANAMQLAPGPGVVILADAAYDQATRKIFKVRKSETYVYALNTRFTRVNIQKEDFTSAKVIAALQQPNVRYISASSHGIPAAILGWWRKDKQGREVNEIVLEEGDYPGAAASGIMFHFLACETGQKCGPALVSSGATAFLGYRLKFKFTHQKARRMLACDAIIDEQLLAGRTAGQAQAAAVERYMKTIEKFKENGYLDEVTLLKNDLAGLVGPLHDTKYGDKNAVIGTP